ncbi:MAG: hypothetical protein ACOYLI_04240 [Synechococcus lacustris]
MSTSPSSAPSPSISKSEYYSSLPWFRRLLAMLNWRPVVDYELREIEFDRREIVHEQRMRQLESEDAQLRKDDEQKKIAHEQQMRQLKSEIERLDELNSKIDVLLFSSSTSSPPPQNTPNNSEG